MAVLLANYKKSVIDDVLAQISSNSAYYYAFAANPIPNVSGVPDDDLGDKTTTAIADWSMLFGKKLVNTDFSAVITNRTWVTNTQYIQWDDTVDLSNSNFYVVVTAGGGADYLVYKCIYNNSNGYSTITPPTSTPSYTTVTLNDGYMWRYIMSIPDATYTKFVPSSNGFIPVVPNNAVVANAGLNSGLDVISIDASGNGYLQYHTGNIASVSNSTYLQIASSASSSPDYYANCSIYIYNTTGSPAGQLLTVANSQAISSQRWVLLTSAANVAAINTASAAYIIAPPVKIDHDGNTAPQAYCTINTTFNSVNSIVIVNTGSYVSRALASIIVANNFGSGAVLRPICPPPGGHGSNPASELFVNGLAVQFKFSNSESNTIPTNVKYTKVGILKNPYALNANNTKGSAFTTNTFSQVLKANVSPSITFSNGAYITGNTSLANGIVAFANSTMVYIVGDKDFSNGEVVTSNGQSANITITTLGDIYTKDIVPIYIQNTDTLTRSATQNETFKVIINI